MRQSNTRKIALGGMLAAVAVVVMCLGGFIPVATYVCPMLCCMTQFIVLRFCGRKLGWNWFIVVSLLSLILGPDKEAAIVFVAVGCYPMLKSVFEQKIQRLLFLFLCIQILFLLKLLFVFANLMDIPQKRYQFLFLLIIYIHIPYCYI